MRSGSVARGYLTESLRVSKSKKIAHNSAFNLKTKNISGDFRRNASVYKAR